MADRDRYYRQVTTSVLQLYLEFECGVLPGSIFDPRVLDYRIDIERIAERELDEVEWEMLMLVHRDGVTAVDAARLLALPASDVRPDRYVANIEIRFGKVLARKKMLDLMGYMGV